MRIPKEWIAPMARRIVDTLVKEKLITEDMKPDVVIKAIEELIYTELSAEDRLNEEVRQMLLKFDFDINRGRLDYRKLFDLTKQKLVKERNLVI